MQKFTLGFWIFLLVGTINLLGCMWKTNETLHFLASAQQTEGRIIDYKRVRDTSHTNFGWLYYPIVQFSAENKVYVFTDNVGTGNSDTSLSITISPDKPPVTVLYDPANPNHAEIKRFISQWIVSLITGFLGIAFTAIGAGGLISVRRQIEKNDWLQANGQRYQARIVSVEEDTRMSVNNRYPWRIVAEYTAPGTTFPWRVNSQDIWHDPREQLQGITTLDVLVDPGNKENYLVVLPESIKP